MEEIGISELTSEQAERLCTIAERATINHVLSKVPSRRVSSLHIAVDTEGLKSALVTVDVEITLSSLMKKCDVRSLAEDVGEEAFRTAEVYLRELTC